MAKFYSPVNFRHTSEEFWTIFRYSKCSVERRRAKFFALLAEGKSESEVLEATHYAVRTAREVVSRYHQLGLEGLKDGRHDNKGAPTLLTPEEKRKLEEQLRANSQIGIAWDGKRLQSWIREQFGKDVYLGRTYEFMRAAGFTPPNSRRHHKNDQNNIVVI